MRAILGEVMVEALGGGIEIKNDGRAELAFCGDEGFEDGGVVEFFEGAKFPLGGLDNGLPVFFAGLTGGEIDTDEAASRLRGGVVSFPVLEGVGGAFVAQAVEDEICDFARLFAQAGLGHGFGEGFQGGAVDGAVDAFLETCAFSLEDGGEDPEAIFLGAVANVDEAPGIGRELEIESWCRAENQWLDEGDWGFEEGRLPTEESFEAFGF